MVRCFLAAAFVVSLPAAASAGDILGSPLRGAYSPETVSAQTSWGGFYGGLVAGGANADMKLGKGSATLFRNALRGSVLETQGQLSSYFENSLKSKVDRRTIGVGAFVGYNWAIDGAVIGLEADYSRIRLKGKQSETVGRSFVSSDNYLYSWTGTGSSEASTSDIATFRVRLGYSMDWFMPYMTGGVAVAHGAYQTTATYSFAFADNASPPVRPGGAGGGSDKNGRSREVATGMALGVGVDMQLMPNLFVRAEYMRYQFAAFGGSDLTFNIARVAAGVKF